MIGAMTQTKPGGDQGVSRYKREQGRLIRAAFDKSGLTQVELAERIGSTQPHISAVFRGATGLSAQKLAAVAKALGVTVDSLTPDMEALAAEPEPGPTPARPKKPAEEENRPPPGLEEFLRDHGKRLKVTKRERYYLEQSRFRSEPWISFDTQFWQEMLEFWRALIKRQDAAAGDQE